MLDQHFFIDNILLLATLDRLQPYQISRTSRNTLLHAPSRLTGVGCAQADIWSMGCTVLEMVTGKPPWSGLGFSNMHALLFHVVHPARTPAARNHAL